MKKNITITPTAIFVFIFMVALSATLASSMFRTSVPHAHAANVDPEAQGASLFVSANNGNWSNPSTWDGGSIPGAGGFVIINSGHTVTYDVLSNAVLGQITIEGTLKFSRSTDTRLKVNNNVIVPSGGVLDMGTPDDFIPRNVTAELIWVLTQAKANDFVDVSLHHVTPESKGLWVLSEGTWDTHGQPLLRTWSKLAQNAAAGNNKVVVENDVSDWYPGGTVVVTQTSLPSHYEWDQSRDKDVATPLPPEHELRTIQSLEPLSNGRTQITLNQPLDFFHEGTAPFQGEVGLLTRNILIKTELLGTSESEQQSDVRERKYAHTAYMPHSKGNTQYAEFKYMGHYGKLGNYAIHYHQMLTTSIGRIIRGNSGWYNGFRCVNLHISHGVLVEDNVCYNAQSTAFFQERDPDMGHNQDNAFIHNLAIDTLTKASEDRTDKSVAGEFHRAASFWAGTNTKAEAFLGNVAAGGRTDATNMGGFRFADNSFTPGGNMPFAFAGNESHGVIHHGIDTWQNGVPSKDMVGSLLWRNGDAGIFWGAYGNAMKYYNTRLLENARKGVEVISVGPFLQDSEFVGTTADGSRDDDGFLVAGYVNAQTPNPPVWVVRNTFKDLSNIGVSQVVREENAEKCRVRDFKGVSGNEDLREWPLFPSECSAAYMVMMDNTFENVDHNLRFSFQANPNSWWKLFGYNYPFSDAQGNTRNIEDFIVVRPDQLNTVEQGVLTRDLVNSQTFYSPDIDGLITPMSSLPGDIRFTNIRDEAGNMGEGDFTFGISKDLPPTVQLNVTTDGTQATITATATDDQGVSKIQLLADWITVKECNNTTTCSMTLDLANIPGDDITSQRRYVYLYARAFDGVSQLLARSGKPDEYEQRAYSNIIEIGPEVLLGNQTTPPQPTSNQAPAVAAGPDQAVTFLSPPTVALNGTVTDDGLPNPPGAFTVQWSKFTGPAPVSFANASAMATNVTFAIPGTYVLRLAGNDGELTSSDYLTVTVTTPLGNQAPVVNAGSNQSATLASPVTIDLVGFATDDGLPDPPADLTTTWTVFSRPAGASVTFGNPNQASTTATFIEEGTYVLRLTASDGELSSFSDITVIVNPTPAEGSLDISNLSVASGQLYQVMDSGLTSGAVVYIDRQFAFNAIPASLQGAYYVQTANDDKREDQESFLSFSVNQDVTVYVAYDSRATALPDWLASWTDTGETLGTTDVPLNLYARDFPAGTVSLGGNKASGAAGVGSNYSVIVGQSSASPQPINQAPVVDAGSDQSATLTSPVTLPMNGSVADDGLPNPSSLLVQWGLGSGPDGASVSFGDPNAVSTSATFTEAGIYILRLNANDGDLSSFDKVTITINPELEREPDPAPLPPGGSLAVSNLSVASGQPYQVMDSGMKSGATVYIDRLFAYTTVPANLKDATYIQTANNDKRNSNEGFLSFSVNRDVRVYVAYDSRATDRPDWLASWANTGETLGTTDVPLDLYAQDYSAGSVSLGGNQAQGASGAKSNYAVIIALP